MRQKQLMVSANMLIVFLVFLAIMRLGALSQILMIEGRFRVAFEIIFWLTFGLTLLYGVVIGMTTGHSNMKVVSKKLNNSRTYGKVKFAYGKVVEGNQITKKSLLKINFHVSKDQYDELNVGDSCEVFSKGLQASGIRKLSEKAINYFDETHVGVVQKILEDEQKGK